MNTAINQPYLHPLLFAGLNHPVRMRYQRSLRRLHPAPDRIIQDICEAFQLEKEKLFSTRRFHEYVKPKYIAYYELYHEGCMTYKAIGKMFHRDHSSVIYGVRQYENLLDTDKKFQSMVIRYRKYIKGDLS